MNTAEMQILKNQKAIMMTLMTIVHPHETLWSYLNENIEATDGELNQHLWKEETRDPA